MTLAKGKIMDNTDTKGHEIMSTKWYGFDATQLGRHLLNDPKEM